MKDEAEAITVLNRCLKKAGDFFFMLGARDALLIIPSDRSAQIIAFFVTRYTHCWAGETLYTIDGKECHPQKYSFLKKSGNREA